MKQLSFWEAERLMGEVRRDRFVPSLDIQEQVNRGARAEEKPCIDLIYEEEHQRILDLIACNTTWSDGWQSNESHKHVWLDRVLADGGVQPFLSAKAVRV